MTDYTKATGSSGTMMIRDTGTTIEFWLKAGSGTYNSNLPWRFNITGSMSATQNFNFVSGGAWQKLKSWSVTTSRTVTFYIGDTGTGGLGGPTTFTVTISRSGVPPAPSIALVGFTSSTISVNVDNNGTGGSAFEQVRVGYGTSSTAPTAYKDLLLSNGTGTITGLAPGTTYYMWGQIRNASGWSARSTRITAKTWGVPPTPTAPVLTNIKQSSLTATFKDNGNGGTAILERQIGYGTNSATPSVLVSSSGVSNLTDIPGGTTVYFRARVRNAVGWSAWSSASTVNLRAGAWITVVTVTTVGTFTTRRVTVRPVVVYIKVNGVWKVATPMVNIRGLWKETG